MDLKETHLQHKTYHHFTGNGSSDSELDKLIFSNDLEHPENVTTIICKLDNPAVDSHHDITNSEFHLPRNKANKATCTNNKKAPKVENNRCKVFWSDEGIKSYQNLVMPELLRIQKLWLVSTTPSKTLLSLLCEATNRILTCSAVKTNKFVKLDKKPTAKSRQTPPHIRKSSNFLLKKHRLLQQALQLNSPETPKIKADYVSLRRDHRKLLRSEKANQARIRDSEAFQILTGDSNIFFKRLKIAKKGKAGQINKLIVDNEVYRDEEVADGFFQSISNLKT